MIKGIYKVRKIAANVSDSELNAMLWFIKGAVYAYNAEDPNKTFSLQALFGGRNNDWHGTPLQVLFDKHMENRRDDAREMASKDAGLLLKRVLHEDENRCYEELPGYFSSYKEVDG